MTDGPPPHDAAGWTDDTDAGSGSGTDGDTGSEPDPDPDPNPDLEPDRARPRRAPLYPRLLRLRHVHPNAWQRALLGEGALALAVVLVLADLASAWTLIALPLGVALVVKAHDVLAGLLGAGRPEDDDGAAPAGATPSDEQER